MGRLIIRSIKLLNFMNNINNYRSIAVGLNKGYQVKKKKQIKKRVITKKNVGRIFVNKIIRDTVGFSPYEKRIMDLLKFGQTKRALKFAKKRLGTHKRAKVKRNEMESILMK